MNAASLTLSLRPPLLAFSILILGLGSGCLIIPTPEHDTGEARSNFNKTSPARIQQGVSRFEDVLLTFGEPDAVSADERKLAFRSEKIVGVWFIAGGYNADGGVLTRDRYLLIELDERGVVQSRKLSTPWFPSTPDRLMKTSETLTKPEHEP